MSRPLRIEYPGALYHVISRGNAYQDIFLNNKDRLNFFQNLEHCIKSHNLICHAYCLMDNHYHLLLETPDANLSKAMRDINGNYTQQFNAQHARVGHVLQGRYKAYLIEKEIYLLQVSRYIVNNPVKANIVDSPRRWRWSSYNATAGIAQTPKWLTTNFILNLFSDEKMEAQRQYRQFVKKGIEQDSPYEELREGIILGSPQFVDWVWNNFQESEEISEVVTSERMIGRPSVKDLFSEVSSLEERNRVIKMARDRAAYTITEIATYLRLHRSTVSKIYNKNT